MVKIKKKNGTEGRKIFNPKLGRIIEERNWTDSEVRNLKNLKTRNPEKPIKELIELFNNNLPEERKRSDNSIRSKLRRMK